MRHFYAFIKCVCVSVSERDSSPALIVHLHFLQIPKFRFAHSLVGLLLLLLFSFLHDLLKSAKLRLISCLQRGEITRA